MNWCMYPWYKNTGCKKTCTGVGADKASLNKSPYIRWDSKFKMKQYPTYCDYMKAKKQCAQSSALLYCAKTCDGCKPKPKPRKTKFTNLREAKEYCAKFSDC